MDQHSKMITLSVMPLTRAQILQSCLEQEGIECILLGEHEITPAYPNGVRVRINESDCEKALPIALHLKEEYIAQGEQIQTLTEDVKLLLVPIDFSESAYNTFEYAYNIAVKLNADIKLLHVYFDASLTPVAAIDSYTYHIGADIDLAEIERKANLEMDTFIDHFNKKYNFNNSSIQVSKELIGGTTEDSILTCALEYNADAIIMGTQGTGSKVENLFGSVAATILDEAKIPVLAIPANCTYGNFSDPTTVLYVTNFEATDYLAIRKLMRLLYVFNVYIICLHVSDGNSDDQFDEIKAQSLTDHLQYEYAGYQVKCIINKSGDIFKAVNDVINVEQIDFVSLNSHRRSLFEEVFSSSLAHRMIKQVKKPLLVFHT